MIPGELIVQAGELALNPGRQAFALVVENTGPCSVHVGSHYHFAEVNAALQFDRAAARGMHLNIAAGSTLGFAPGVPQTVQLVAFAGTRHVFGFGAGVQGPL